MSSKSLRTAAVLAIGYLAVGLAYIVLSGRLAAHVADSVASLELVEKVKGVGFIVVTAALLFVFSAWLFARAERAALDLARERERLLLSERRARVGTLAAAIAHDFNNLLTALWVAVEDLSRDDVPEAERQELLATSMRALETARELTRRLAEAAKGRRASEPQPVRVAALVRDTLRLLAGHTMLRGCRVDLDAGDVPEILSDPVVITQILTNLVLNAGEAVGDGRVQVVVRAERDGVALEVHDDGPGFDGEPVFAPFISSRERGSGLGLLSVKSGVELLGGTVVAGRSALGGASMVVWLPRERAPQAVDPEPPPHP